MATDPAIATACAVLAGIHTARCVGTTHALTPVDTVITPREAKTS